MQTRKRFVRIISRLTVACVGLLVNGIKTMGFYIDAYRGSEKYSPWELLCCMQTKLPLEDG